MAFVRIPSTQTLGASLVRTALAALLLVGVASAQPKDDLNFTSAIGELRDISRELPEYFTAQTRMYVANRPKIATLSALRARGEELRAKMLRNLGGLPERTPLNAKVVGTLERDHYRIEKIIFESQPKLYVTANLYIPKSGTPPYP